LPTDRFKLHKPMKRILFIVSVVACFAIVLLINMRPLLKSEESHVGGPRVQHDAMSERPPAATMKKVSPGSPVATRNSDSSRASTGVAPISQGQANKPATARKDYVRVKIGDVAPERFDPSVVGRPFPISASVRPVCSGNGDIDCELDDSLTRFSQEPRDGNWAPSVEERVRSIVESRNPGFAIRNLECRATLCAMEVESSQGQLGPRRNVSWEEGLAARVLPLVTTTGEEMPKYGQNYVTVTLLLYERIQ
jgi:hypothetical protein